ncbi:MAG: hypothetical protein ACR2MD_18670 [Aridibacter sp.]|jgi:hypothetical protein|nr:hypothetical protein [Acidobacteriota bacterium]
MTNAEIFKSEIWREFEAIAKAEKENPVNVLVELMNEYIESRSDSVLFDEIAEEGFQGEYTEDDAVEIVRQARLERSRG